MVEKFEAMLQGDITDMPPKPPSEVRIFMSSTFSGTTRYHNIIIISDLVTYTEIIIYTSNILLLHRERNYYC